MTIILIIVVLAVFVLAAIIKVVSSDGKTSYIPNGTDFKLKSSILTATELNFYNSLDIAIAGRYLICPKVRLADYVDCKNNSNGNFNRIKSKHCDFLICSRAMKPLFVIELDDKSHQTSSNTINNDKFKDTLYNSIGLKIIRIKVSSTYSTQELRNLMS